MKKKHMKKSTPKSLTGMLKQTEGYTPKEALSKGREAGALKRSAKKREKRLEKVPM